MAEERKVNVMSVELAIRRELAYREKVASSLTKEEIADLLPLKVPYSTKVTSPDPNLTHFSGKSSISLQRPWPGPCPISGLTLVAANQVSFSYPNVKPSPAPSQDPSPYPGPSLEPASTHSEIARKPTTSSLHHLSNQHRHPYRIGSGNDIFCQICNVSCSGSVCYKQHMRGQKHKAKLRFMQLNGNEVVRPNKNLQQPRCDVCQIFCTDESSLDLHLKGHKHKAKLEQIELGQKRKTPPQLWCQLCQVPCINEETFRLHLKGKAHAARSCASREQKNAMQEEARSCEQSTWQYHYN